MPSQIIKNTFWLTVGEIAGRALRIILVIYAARVLGAAEWGIASYILSWAVLFTIATDIGLTAILTRHLIRHPAQSARYLSTVFCIKCSLLLISSLAIIAIVPRIETLPLSQLATILLFGLVFFDSLRLIPSAINKARETMRYEALISTITQGAILMIGIYILSRMPSAEGLMLAYVIGSAIGTGYAAFTVKKYLPQLFIQCDTRLARKLLGNAWPIAVIGLLGSIMLNTDILMIGWFKTVEDIGYYSAAQKIIFTLYVMATVIASAAFPAFARAAHNTPAFKNIFMRTMRNAVIIALVITACGILTAPVIIRLAYGTAYLPATPSFIILLLTLPLTYTITIMTNALLAHNAQKKFVAYAALGVTGNIIGNGILIPLWGIAGAALATLLTQTITALCMWQKIQKINRETA